MKKQLAIMMACVLLFTAVPVQAAPTSLSDTVIDATMLLETLLKIQYEDTLSELEEYIYEEGYDYVLSMQSLEEKENTFQGADYLGIISAYITVTEPGVNITQFDFLTVETEEAQYESILPYKTYEYKEVKPGVYERGGVRYLTEAQEVALYEENGDGTYRKSGSEKFVPETEMLPYLDCTIRMKTPEEILAEYGTGEEESEYERRYEQLKASGVSSAGLSGCIMVNFMYQEVLEPEQTEALEIALSAEDANRRALVSTAASLLGRVPYQWGGKASGPGYDESWWTIDENGAQKGLDCSGFVSWVYQTAGYGGYAALCSTGEILKNAQTITEEELLPGDIGVLNNGTSVNHTGIYLGNGYFIHCSSGKGTVIISQFPFTIFKRAPGIETASLEYHEDTSLLTASESDVLLLAKLVSHEARGQGLNGWIAVAEVVMNRVESSQFPNTVGEVIYSPGQFTNVGEIAEIEPDPRIVSVCQAVMQGQVKILNNKDVLFFRNAGEETGADWGAHKAVTVINDHTFYEN